MSDKNKTAEELKADELAAANKKAAENAQHQKETAAEIEKAADKLQKESIVPVTDTVAKIDAASEKALEESASSETSKTVLDLGHFATATAFVHDEHGRPTHPNDVKFEVTNPKDTSLQKGIIVVSQETAEEFKAKGYGKIVK